MKVKFSRKAIGDILKSQAVEADLLARAKRIASASGGERIGYTASSMVGKNRARASVMTTTVHAMRHNAKYNTLLRNLDAGR